MKQIILSVFALLSIGQLKAQDSTTVKNNLTISGYIEPYYAYDFNRTINNTRPGFIFSHNRTNEVTLNLGMIKAAYNNEKVRGNLALAAGTYMNANLAVEPGVLKNIFQADAGVKISKSADLWIDAGIMPSHIGFESAIGKDNWTLTRSLLADNSPYYEAGAKIGYTSKNAKWYAAAMYLNGWQRIQRVDGNTTPAFGAQLTYKPTSKITLNYSNFIGNDKPDSVRQTRFFNNVYGIFQVSDKLGITAGFDYGIEQKFKGSNNFNTWYTPVVILRFTPTTNDAVAVRGEYYSDENGVIIASGTPNGFKTFGASINYDRTIRANMMFRIELKSFGSKDEVFVKRNLSTTKNNTAVSTSFTIAF